jgi:hypothetical protein
MAEVSRAHVDSFTSALVLVVPIHRPKPVFMCCQEPLDISTAQLDTCKWVDTLFNVWHNSPSFSQVLLSLSVNLRFCAPVLP